MRIGNGAYNQRQHDVWGAVLDSVYLHTQSRDRLDERLWPILKRQVEQAHRALARARPRHLGGPRRAQALHVLASSCAGSRSTAARGWPALRDEHELAERWQAVADEIHADICANGVDERGVFTQHYDTDALDASLLLVPLVRFLPADDQRVRATVLRDRRRADRRRSGAALPGRGDRRRPVRRGGHVHDLLVLAGVGARARSASSTGPASCASKLLSFASPLELYAEEIDPHSGRHLGNFPQAFTHLALINAVMHVIRAEADRGRPRNASGALPAGSAPLLCIAADPLTG